MRFGVPASGPVDRFAFAAAHAALGNRSDAGLIELSLGGALLRCADAPVGFALCGGDFAAEVDGLSIGGWVVGTIEPGQRLRIRSAGKGGWACLALAGRVVAPTWLGSAATHALSGLGGGALPPGATVAVEAPRRAERPGPLPIAPPPPIEMVRIVAGPQQRFFASDALDRLIGATFAAGAAFDRMGRAVDGPALVPLSLDMPSEPALRGALQIDGAGRMTLLSADHQTTGGYPKIATAIGPDADRVAQLPSGWRFRFAVLDQAGAIAAVRAAATDQAEQLRRIATRSTLDERLAASNLISGVVSDDADIG